MRACGIMLLGLATGCGASAPPAVPTPQRGPSVTTPEAKAPSPPTPKADPALGDAVPWKDPRLDPRPLDTTEYSENITCRVWIETQKTFLNPTPAHAKRIENKDGTFSFHIHNLEGGGTQCPVNGSEITDAAGTVYVTIAHLNAPHNGERVYTARRKDSNPEKTNR